MKLRYWFQTGFRSLAMLLGASLLYCALMSLQMSELEAVETLLPIYLLLFGVMMDLGMSLSLYKFNVPLALSFGSTRGEALLGLQVARLIPAVFVTAILVVLTALTGGFMEISALIPLSLGLFLGASAIGSVMGIIYTKWGKVSLLITVVVVLMGAFGIEFLSAFFSDGWLAALTDLDTIGWLVLCIGFLLYSLMLIPESRTVWKCNVKL